MLLLITVQFSLYRFEVTDTRWNEVVNVLAGFCESPATG